MNRSSLGSMSAPGMPGAFGLLILALSGPTRAEAPPSATAAATPPPTATQVGEVIVTAQKTSENILHVPVAVTAVSNSDLAKQHITDIQALTASIPNFNFGTFGGTARLAIRGVGFDSIDAGAEGRVAYYVDGVYYSRPATAIGSFFDVDHLEVLRGPQGTLYGRNATGGAVNTFTADPTSSLSGYFNETLGNYNLRTEEGALSGPVTPRLDLRLAFQFVNRDGYGKNLLTGDDIDNANTESFRFKAKYKVTDDFTVIAALDYHKEADNDFAAHYGGAAYPAIFPAAISTLLPESELGAPAPANIRDVANQRDPTNHREFWGAGVTATYDWGDLVLKSITGYRSSRYLDFFSLETGLTDPNTQLENAYQVSQELQLSRTGPRLTWLVGVYGFDEHVRGLVDVPLGSAAIQYVGLPAVSSPNGYVQGYWAGGTQTTKTVAGYAQASYYITKKLQLTAGLRLAAEQKDVHDADQFDILQPYLQPNPVTTNPPPAVNGLAYYNPHSGEIKESSATPKVSLSYEFRPRLTTYVTVAEGYKSGGFDLGAAAPAYQPEKLWDYEGGIKGEFFDRRVKASLAGFYYDYKNLQVSLVKNNVVLTQNAATARSYGAEFEAEARLTRPLRLTFSGGYLNAKFTKYITSDPAVPGSPVMDYAGYTLSQSPEFQGKFGADYSIDLPAGAVTFRGDIDYVSRVYFTPFDQKTISQGDNTKVNASVDYVSATGRWHVSVYGRNLTDKTTESASTVATTLIGDPLVTYLDPPRTFGVTFGVRY